ncbi:MAG: hypothetical protein AAGK23_09010 [Pseudomonadota bacterium]
MSALPKQMVPAASQIMPALLVAPQRLSDLQAAFAQSVDLTGQSVNELVLDTSVDLVLIELGQPGANELLEHIVKTAPETKVLAIGDALPAQAVRAMLRLQASDLAAAGAAPGDIVKAAARLMEIAPDGPTRRNLCWVVAGAVGGAGATTLAIELACATASRDPENTVCLVDLNLADGMLASYLEGSPKLDLIGLSDAPERLDPTLLGAYAWEHETGVTLISAPRNPDIHDIAGADLILRLLDTVCAVYSHVIVDMPRTRQAWSKPILSGVDEVLVVSEFTVPSLHAAADMTREVDALRPDETVSRLVLNRMSDSKTEFSVSRASKAIEREIGAVIRSDWKSARAAVNLGMPIQSVKPKSKMVKDVMTLLKLIDPALTETGSKRMRR